MKRTIGLGLAVLAALGATNPSRVDAAEFLAVGSLDFSFKDLAIEAGETNRTKFNTTLTTLNPSVVLAYGNFYASLGYDKSIDSETVSQFDDNLPSALNMSRSDITATVGYRVLSFLSVFAGWLKGDTGVYIAGTTNHPTLPSPATISYTQEISYVEQGPFVGLALSHAFGNKGALSFSAAYASLNAEFSEDRYHATVPLNVRSNHAETDSKGLSYSLIWTGQLTGSLHYRVGAKYTKYEGDPLPDSGSIIETYTLYFLGLTNYF